MDTVGSRWFSVPHFSDCSCHLVDRRWHVQTTMFLQCNDSIHTPFFYYFKYDIPHTSDNLATQGAVYKLWVIQVNRLSQVLTHKK